MCSVTISHQRTQSSAELNASEISILVRPGFKMLSLVVPVNILNIYPFYWRMKFYFKAVTVEYSRNSVKELWSEPRFLPAIEMKTSAVLSRVSLCNVSLLLLCLLYCRCEWSEPGGMTLQNIWWSVVVSCLTKYLQKVLFHFLERVRVSSHQQRAT